MLAVSGVLMSNLSGSRNIRLGLLAKGFSPEEVAELYPAVVEQAGIKDALHNPVRTYSSGMKARLKFAVAVAKTPEILLVDDSRVNIMAAEKHSWHVLWFDEYRPDESVKRVQNALELS